MDHQRRLTIRFTVFLLSLSALFGLLAAAAKRDPYFSYDVLITQALQHTQALWFERLMLALTYLGNPVPGIALLVLYSILFLTMRWRKEAAFLLVSAGGGELISVVTKTLVHRPRPSADLIKQAFFYSSADSFPSGHVLFFVSVYGFLLYLTYTKLRHSWLRSCLAFLFGCLIVLIGVSRIFLGAHWFSDVLGAYLIGSVWLSCVCIMYHTIKLPKSS